MPRIRSVRPEFFSSVPVAECSRIARLLSIALWCHADDDGRCVDDARVIRAFAFPMDEDITAAMVDAILEELHLRSRIARYVVDGRKYLQIHNFKEHQRPQKPLPSKLPTIPDDYRRPTSPVPVREDYGTSLVALPSVVVVGEVVGVGETDSAEPAVAVPAPLRVERRSEARPVAKFPGFSQALCKAAYDHWEEHAGSAGAFPLFRKTFGPLFARPESERPEKLPRDAELLPAIRMYLAAIKGTRSAQFVSPQACARHLTQIVAAMRDADDTETRLIRVQFALGLTGEVRQMQRQIA